MIHGSLFLTRTEEWTTPLGVYRDLDRRFGPFDLDAAATDANHLAMQYWTKDHDALRQRWIGRVFLNPPYGRGVGAWIEKARNEVLKGNASVVVVLVPARVDTRWWHDYVEPGRRSGRVEVEFYKGRLPYGGMAPGQRSRAPFPSCAIIFTREQEGVRRCDSDRTEV